MVDVVMLLVTVNKRAYKSINNVSIIYKWKSSFENRKKSQFHLKRLLVTSFHFIVYHVTMDSSIAFLKMIRMIHGRFLILVISGLDFRMVRLKRAYGSRRISWVGSNFTRDRSLCEKVCQFIWWFSPGNPVLSIIPELNIYI